MTDKTDISISVVIPAYNAEAYIEQAIDSVLGQTHLPFEVLVVDDGSTDGTVDAICGYGSDVTLLRQENGGAAKARNHAVRHTRGEWIAFLDADDVWEPYKLEKQIALVDSKTGLVYTDRINFGELGGMSKKQSDVVEHRRGKVYEQLVVDGNFVTLSSALVPRLVFDEVSGFDETLSNAQDWDLWLRIAEKWEVELVPEALVKYRCVPNSMSKNIAGMWASQRSILRRVFSKTAARQLPTECRRKAWARASINCGFFAQNSHQFRLAVQLYLRSLIYDPVNLQTWKSIVKCVLRRR
ncbi:glycosyltransferase family 2 protein [Rhodopirellula sp. SWK7]|uniref:glycosyltransferase family 2 protein n=1 Tax=Rhodopirellula sp. SWK7 TaxID=595460 RepID=UPI00034B4908|nr:glycosyltransferase family 2 protein [Rhodopirellula sp. SWK7]